MAWHPQHYQKKSCKFLLSHGFSRATENCGVLGSIPSLATRRALQGSRVLGPDDAQLNRPSTACGASDLARAGVVHVSIALDHAKDGARQLKPPSGYRPTTQLQPRVPRVAHAADVPASPIRCALIVTCLVGEFSAPVSHAPGVWADYWGPHWSEHLDIVDAINHSLEDFTDDEFADPAAHIFWEPLAQYEVGPGKFLGDEIVSNSPGKAVGSNGILEVVWFVLSHRWGTPAPKFWWRYWGNSPIFAIFVDESEVDSSSWAGYHAFAPTEGIFLWWLVHPAMPFFIVKVPNLATLGTSGSSS
jgi:hypothetical protein